MGTCRFGPIEHPAQNAEVVGGWPKIDANVGVVNVLGSVRGQQFVSDLRPHRVTKVDAEFGELGCSQHPPLVAGERT